MKCIVETENNLFCINIESSSALCVDANIRKLFRIAKIPKISNRFKTCVSVQNIAIVVLTFLRMSEQIELLSESCFSSKFHSNILKNVRIRNSRIIFISEMSRVCFCSVEILFALLKHHSRKAANHFALSLSCSLGNVIRITIAYRYSLL